MRVIHISDARFAKSEGELLRRVEVGLIDEGVGVMRVRPRGLIGENTAGLGARVDYDTARTLRFGPSRAMNVVTSIQDQIGAKNTDFIDVVHAWGTGCWQMAIQLAQLTDADLVVSLHDRAALQRARWLDSRLKRASLSPALALAPDNAHAQALAGHAPGMQVRVVPWGVHLHAGQDTRAAIEKEHVSSICVIGSGKSPREIDALLDGLETIATKHPDALVFFDSALVARHGHHWKRLRRLSFESTPSLIENLESHRQTVLEADVLIAPESSGVYHSIVLEALGSRMGVVVRRDPLVDLYNEDNGMVVVNDPVGSAWATAIERLLDENERAALASVSRRHIEQNHLAYMQVRGMIEAYDALRGEEPIALHTT